MDVTVIDPAGCDLPGLPAVRGLGTEAGPLREAGVERSVGLVAGTDDDVNNLSIAVTARELNPGLFTILRQNLQANRALFDAYRASITMVSSEIVAHECLAVLKTPRLAPFLDAVREKGDAWADALVERLHAAVGEETPELWGVPLTPSGAPAIHQAIAGQGREVALGALSRDPAQRDHALACVPLAIARGNALLLLPAEGEVLQAGDEILYAGTPEARDAQWPMLRNLNERDYVLDGIDRPGGWVWQWWEGRRARP